MSEHKHDSKNEPGRALAARFASAAEAREAVAALHKAHYKHTWFGATSVGVDNTGTPKVTVESHDGLLSETHGLVDALVSHGVLGDTARSIEHDLQPGEALVTVEPKDRDVRGAIAILEEHGGSVDGRTFEAGMWASDVTTRGNASTIQPPFER